MYSKRPTLMISVLTFTFFTQVAIATQTPSAAPVSSDITPSTGKNEPGLTNWQKIQKRVREAREARLKREANEKAKMESPKTSTQEKTHLFVTQELPTPEPHAVPETKTGCVENPSDFKGTFDECHVCLEKAEKEENEIFHKVCDAKMNYYYGPEGWGTKKPSEKETQEYQDINKRYTAANKTTDGWYSKLNELSKGPSLGRGPRPTC